MFRKIIFIAISLMIIVSCKKEKTIWNTDWSAPIAYGHLTINDMIPVEYTTTNTDNYLSLIYHESVYSFSLDTVLNLPDTQIVNKYAISIPSFNFNPGATIPSILDQAMDMGDVELKQVIIKSGTSVITMRNSWPGLTYIGFNFPQVLEGASTFSRSYTLPAGTISNPTEETEVIDVADFNMDLTGSDGNFVNTLYGVFDFGSAETTDIITVSSSDTIYYIIEFIDVIPKYARGYFGQYSVADTVGLSLEPMKKIVSGMIDIDSIDMVITVKNGFKLISQSTITKISGINSNTGGVVDLTFPLLNSSLNINPASGGYYDWVASEYPIPINNTNSSITSFIENLPDSIELGFQIDINPYGNISGGNDEFFPESEMELFLDAEFPLKFSANDLTIVDTFDIDYTSPETTIPKNGQIVLSYINGFPLEALTKFYLLDGDNVLLDSIVSSSPIGSGQYDTGTYLTTPYSNTITFNISQSTIENLELTEKMVLLVSFTTDQSQMIKIDADAFFDFNLRTNLEIQINL